MATFHSHGGVQCVPGTCHPSCTSTAHIYCGLQGGGIFYCGHPSSGEPEDGGPNAAQIILEAAERDGVTLLDPPN